MAAHTTLPSASDIKSTSTSAPWSGSKLKPTSEAADSFEPVEIALDRAGRSALLRDGAGQILLLRQHGTHFAGRVLTPAAYARIDGEALVVDTAEKRYGGVRLELDDPSLWVQHIESIKPH